MSQVLDTPDTILKKNPAKLKNSIWDVVIDNDPINTMGYVTKAIRAIFGYNETEAQEIMLKVHNNGKATAWSGCKEKAESYLVEVLKWKITAHLEEKDD